MNVVVPAAEILVGVAITLFATWWLVEVVVDVAADRTIHRLVRLALVVWTVLMILLGGFVVGAVTAGVVS